MLQFQLLVHKDEGMNQIYVINVLKVKLSYAFILGRNVTNVISPIVNEHVSYVQFSTIAKSSHVMPVSIDLPVTTHGVHN